MVVDADTVEARILATRGEGGDLGQRPADRNADRDAEPGHVGASSMRAMLHAGRDDGQPADSGEPGLAADCLPWESGLAKIRIFATDLHRYTQIFIWTFRSMLNRAMMSGRYR
jgi:hypothetical protein